VQQLDEKNEDEPNRFYSIKNEVRGITELRG
jgi:hypothetical protein